MDQDKHDQEQAGAEAEVTRKTDNGEGGWHEEPMTAQDFVRQTVDLSTRGDRPAD